MSLNRKDLLQENTVIAAKSAQLESPLYESYKVSAFLNKVLNEWETITSFIYFHVPFQNDIKVALKSGT